MIRENPFATRLVENVRKYGLTHISKGFPGKVQSGVRLRGLPVPVRTRGQDKQYCLLANRAEP